MSGTQKCIDFIGQVDCQTSGVSANYLNFMCYLILIGSEYYLVSAFSAESKKKNFFSLWCLESFFSLHVMSVTLELPLALHILEGYLAENKYVESYVVLFFFIY